MKYMYNQRAQRWTALKTVLSVIVSCAVVFTVIIAAQRASAPIVQALSGSHRSSANPLAGKTLYIDHMRPVNQLVSADNAAGKTDEAAALKTIADQPGSTWLVGPSASDPEANRDIDTVQRTSADASSQHSVPVYVLYAIPQRDACAGYSNGGFSTNSDYLNWIDRITGALKSDAAVVVEPDAIGHTITADCLSDAQKSSRYDLIHQAVDHLRQQKDVIAIYLDAGNPEWISDPQRLVDPLKRAGIDDVRGVSVNVSSFVSSDKVTPWAQRLTASLGGNKGVIIDTSRNGNGAPDPSVTGTARWCNPSGRAIGHAPTTQSGVKNIDAYFWGKNIGESDGDCFGNPPAGTFIPAMAVELVKNAQ